MAKLIDLSGCVFGELTVIERDCTKGRTRWKCKCSCGNIKSIEAMSLKSGHSKSCGCRRVLKGVNSHAFKDLTGQVFGELVVQCLAATGTSRGTLWDCLCNCGNTTIASTNNLRSSQKKSCGHLTKQTGAESRFWKGYEEISGSYWKQIKTGAKSRHLEMTISIKDIWGLFQAQRGLCALTGVPIQFGTHQTASLDRIDSSIGYIEDNVQWVHKDINRMKQNFSEEKFIMLCQLVVQYNAQIR